MVSGGKARTVIDQIAVIGMTTPRLVLMKSVTGVQPGPSSPVMGIAGEGALEVVVVGESEGVSEGVSAAATDRLERLTLWMIGAPPRSSSPQLNGPEVSGTALRGLVASAMDLRGGAAADLSHLVRMKAIGAARSLHPPSPHKAGQAEAAEALALQIAQEAAVALRLMRRTVGLGVVPLSLRLQAHLPLQLRGLV